MTSTNTDVTSDVVLKALSDPLRRRIVALLAREQLCNCHLTEATGAGQTTVSNALRVLREAGMVETEPCGRFTYYRLLAEPLAGLADELSALARSAVESPDHKRPC